MATKNQSVDCIDQYLRPEFHRIAQHYNIVFTYKIGKRKKARKRCEFRTVMGTGNGRNDQTV